MTWGRRGSFVLLAKLTTTAHLSQAQVQSCQLAVLLRKSPLLCMQGDPCQPTQGSQNLHLNTPIPPPVLFVGSMHWNHRKGVLVLPSI